MMLDHSHTKVVLIGNSQYPNWTEGNIKNIEVNLKELKDVLCNPDYVGIKDDPDSIIVLHNMGKTQILVELNKMIKKCSDEDTMVVYYAGHGLLDQTDIKQLFMATGDTMMDDKISTCVHSNEFKNSLNKCRAGNKITILDCCYAGRLSGLQSDPESLRNGHWGGTEGVYFLMSSDIDTPSRFDPDNDSIPTFFTQKMVQTIKDGADKGQDIWTLDDFFDNMKTNWDLQKAPMPLSLTYQSIGKFPFCYNHFRRAKVTNTDEEKLEEIKLDPTEEKLQNFIDESNNKELIKKANELWRKLKSDWDLLNKAIDEGTFEALSKFIDDVDPLKPVLKKASSLMKEATNKTSRSSAARSNEDFGGAATSKQTR